MCVQKVLHEANIGIKGIIYIRKYGIFCAGGIIYTMKRKGRLPRKALLCSHTHSNIEYKQHQE